MTIVDTGAAKRLARRRKKQADNAEVTAAMVAIDARKATMGIKRKSVNRKKLLREFKKSIREAPSNTFGCYLDPIGFNPEDLEENLDLY